MIHIPSLKSTTKKTPIQKLAAPNMLYLPLTTYKGTLSTIVEKDSYVKKHQKVAASEGVFASSIHAPASGHIRGEVNIDNQSYLMLENDFKEVAIPAKQFTINNITEDEILSTLLDFGIEGSGGAKFPTHTKYNTGSKPIDTFIINAAECEPYLSADYTLLKNYTKQLLEAIQLMQKVIKASAIVFGIEKQHKELKPLILQTAKNLGIPVKIKLLPNEYPQGGELQLIKSVTGKEILKGSIPANYGIVVSNVGTLWAIYNAFYKGTPYTNRIVTISGEKAENIGNYEVAIGTPVSHILETIGLTWNATSQTVILGGPMMGKAVQQPQVGINKGSGGILIIPNPTNKRYNCIQCGYCVDVCPQHLMPMEFARYSTTEDTPQLKNFHVNDCIECGACAYICPSDVPLMNSIFKGKELLKATSL